MNDFLNQQVPLGLVLVFLQNYLKQQRWFPWLSYQSARMNHLFAILAAGVATFGVHTSHTGSFMQGGQLLIAWPAVPVILTGIWHWLTQYIAAKASYTVMANQLNPPTAQQPTPVVLMPGSKTLSGDTGTLIVAPRIQQNGGVKPT